MIIAYGGKNCWSFKEWVEIDFRINKNVPEQYGFEGLRIVPALCFEGANASGKSCALKVLSFIVDFCLNSFFYAPASGIIYDTFFNNKEKSEFYINFMLPNDSTKEYMYEVTMDNNKVYSEILYYVEKNGKKTKEIIAKRKGNSFVVDSFSGDAKGIILKPNSSLVSTCIQYGIKEFDGILSFLKNVQSNVSYLGTYVDPLRDSAAEYYYNNPDILKKTVDIIKRFDVGLSDIKINKAFDTVGKDIFISSFSYEIDDEIKDLSFFSQSTGTKILYNRLRDFILVLEEGGFLIFDELDTHLHSAIIPILLNMFLDEKQNTKKAQLIFTSHDTAIMDLMKKYRIYLFKKQEGESFCYRIDELPKNISFRNDRSLEQVYLSGLIGGTPNV